MRRNHWATDKTAMASWVIHFRKLEGMTQVEAVFQLVSTIFAAGDAYEVYKTRSPREYLQNARSEYDRRGSVTLFNDLQPVARVAYFNPAGIVKEETVGDAGALLLRLEEKSGLDRYSSSCPPVAIATLDTLTEGQPFEIRLALFTDLWFPGVRGLVDPGLDYRLDSGELLDNSPLAERHTPRLNRFIQAIGGTADAAGGTLDLEGDSEPIYQPYVAMCSRQGIWLKDMKEGDSRS